MISTLPTCAAGSDSVVNKLNLHEISITSASP